MEQLLLRSAAALRTVFTQYSRGLLHEISWSDPLIFILGPRGVGKTTMILQRLLALDLPPEKAIYVDLGDLYFQVNRLIDFAEAYLEQGGRYLFIDEVHRYGFDTWSSELKQLYDLYRGQLSIVVTGSSIVRILNQQADLSRRALSYQLAGLSFREYLHLKEGVTLSFYSLDDLLHHHRDISRTLAKSIATPLAYLQDYWRKGYYPYFLDGTEAYANRLANSIQTVLEHDIPYATDGASVDARKLGRLLYAVASSVPFLPNMNKLSERTGISRVTLLRYLQLLEQARIIHALRRESKGITALGKPDKLYLDNPNLLHALAPQQVSVGTLRETFVLNQLVQLTYDKGLVPPEIRLPQRGDLAFVSPARRIVFEIGGADKNFARIGEEKENYVVADTTFTEHAQRIPLWLFGMLY